MHIEQATDAMLCAFCREQPIYGGHPCVLLQGGAMRRSEERGNELELAADCEGFLQLMSRHPKRGGAQVLPLAEHAHGGQFSLAFCSTKCLREYVNGRIDLFEIQAGR